MTAPVIPVIDPDRIPQRDGSQTQGVYSDNMDYFATQLPITVDAQNDLGEWMNTTANEVDSSSSAAVAAAMDAQASAAAALASANSAVNSPGTSATSSTSLTPSLGSKSLTLDQTGKAFVVGQFVLISDTTNPTGKFIRGGITAFNAGTGAMTIDVADYNGSTAGTTWAITPTAPSYVRGVVGAPVVVTGNSVTAVAGGNYVLSYSAGVTTVAWPATAIEGQQIRVVNSTGRADVVLQYNGTNIYGFAENFILNIFASLTFEYIDATFGWRVI